jgi:hypothetical protein
LEALTESDAVTLQRSALPDANAEALAAFLEELRLLDSRRAFVVSNSAMLARDLGYADALARIRAAADDGRAVDWAAARDSAGAAARQLLGSSPLTSEVVELVANMAGAITVRDLVAAEDFDLVLMPWTRRSGEPATVRASWQPVLPKRPRFAVSVDPRSGLRRGFGWLRQRGATQGAGSRIDGADTANRGVAVEVLPPEAAQLAEEEARVEAERIRLDDEAR